MLEKQDLLTLQEAGINNIETLASAAAALLRAHPIYTVPLMPNALSEQEEAFLRQGGAVGVGGTNKDAAAANVTIIAGHSPEPVKLLAREL